MYLKSLRKIWKKKCFDFRKKKKLNKKKKGTMDYRKEVL